MTTPDTRAFVELKLKIAEIGIDSDGYLFVRPALQPSANFEFIWRDASGIRWSETRRVLHAYEPARWEHFALYKQILNAVRSEYGESLEPTVETQWSQVTPELKKTIEAWHVAA
jgi:hypothetical protein